MIMTTNPTYFQSVTVKLASGQNLAAAKQELEAIYKSIYPYETAEFKFLDEEIAQFYAEDLRIRNVLGAACVLAILISIMGLFALSSYTIAQRSKEISIRKVLGATLAQILGLITKEYVLLVGISFLLAIFPAYYFLRDWLNGFQYRVDMPYFLFVLSGLGVLLICLLIVGLHSYIAAQTNPAKVLKDE
jgi:ABC-type antimicrobial peptide transport system permease subunit